MSKLDILNEEITRRKASTASLLEGQADLKAVIEKFNKLDESYRTDEKASREMLECLYKENRHFTGQWTIVYSFAETEFYPFFQGQLDTECNPYFPAEKVIDKTFDGVSPLFSPITRTGGRARVRAYAGTEDTLRTPALSALNNFPDITNEPLPAGWPGGQTSTGSCSNPIYTNQATCEANSETWTLTPVPDPVWNGPDTAPALLRTALNSWKSDIQLIIADLCNDIGPEQTFWQGIVDDIDIVLVAVATDAVFVRATGNNDPAAWGQTQDFTPSSPEDLARARLITAATTNVPSHVSTRTTFLSGEAVSEEQLFFGIIKLRAHQVNGSYAKLRAAKAQKDSSALLIADNNDAIKSLNLLKVKSS